MQEKIQTFLVASEPLKRMRRLMIGDTTGLYHGYILDG